MSTNISTTSTSPQDEAFVIEAFVYTPTVGEKPGRFIDMSWQNEPKKNGAVRKDLLVVVELEEKIANGQHVQVTHSFNFHPRGRGKSQFKKLMEGFLERPLTPEQLAGFSKTTIIGKPVIVNYNTDRFGHVVFHNYLPVKQTEAQAT
jgi:hypothetical protein